MPSIANQAAQNTYFAQLLIEEAVRLGVTTWCIAPGSRSTALTLAVSTHPNCHSFVHFDERGLGFFALGLAKAKGSPVGIITTSGTAVANLLPAVIEAHYSQTPLLILTADRPFELLDCGANQAINQTRIFGEFVQCFAQLPAPPDHAKAWLTTLDYAIQQAKQGPVHLNMAFREPFLSKEKLEFDQFLKDETLSDWSHAQRPYTQWVQPQFHYDEKSLAALSLAQKPLILMGELSKQDANALKPILSQLKAPIIAECTAQLSDLSGVLDERCLSSDVLTQAESLIHIGGAFAAKSLQNFIAKSSLPYYHLQFSQNRQNPAHKAGIIMSLQSGCPLPPVSIDAWPKPDLEALTEFKIKTQEKFATWADTQTTLSEPLVMASLAQNLPDTVPLFCGNSLSIRALNRWGQRNAGYAHVFTNRGASGIDGLLATALGAAHHVQSPMLAIIGDLSLLHDLNSMALAATLQHPFVLVVLNNQGGGIFSQLPVGQLPQSDTFFVAKHPYQFSDAAAQFKWGYHEVSTPKDFEAQLEKALKTPGSTLIEVKIPENSPHYTHLIQEHF